MKEARSFLISLACIGAPFLAGAIGGLFTTPNVTTWYRALARPSWTPPSWVFGPVWTTLYLLMGIAAALVWQKGKLGRGFALAIFFVQLVVNALWSVVFFGLHSPLFAMLVIIVLLVLIVWLMRLFAAQSRAAAWLLAPYLLWVLYASTLNLGIVLLN